MNPLTPLMSVVCYPIIGSLSTEAFLRTEETTGTGYARAVLLVADTHRPKTTELYAITATSGPHYDFAPEMRMPASGRRGNGHNPSPHAKRNKKAQRKRERQAQRRGR